MDVIEYKGKTYKRYSSKWSDENNYVVSDGMQRELNNAYVKNVDISGMTIRELIVEGDRFKKSGSYMLALKYYEEVVEQCNIKDMAYVLPRMTSSYRSIGQPSKAIETFSFAKQKFGAEFLTAPLLISAAAAYCDMGEYDNAKKCCDRAWSKLDGKASEELTLVYKRIEKERSHK